MHARGTHLHKWQLTYCSTYTLADCKSEPMAWALQVHSYRNPVRFTDAASAVPAGAILLEIGPHSILRSPLRQSRPDLPYVGAMKKGDSAVETLEAAVCELWGRGVPVQWDATPVPNKPQACEGALTPMR